jgi:hypothetical protein
MLQKAVRARALQIAAGDVLDVLDALTDTHRACMLRGPPLASFDGIPTIGGSAYAHCIKQEAGTPASPGGAHAGTVEATNVSCLRPQRAGTCTFCGQDCCNSTVPADTSDARVLDFSGTGLVGGDYFCSACFATS